MNRMEKWADKRCLIEKENKAYAKSHPYDYILLICSQKQIKKELGCKH